MSSKNVEQRVVQMIFDNDSFNRGIANTMTALSSLDKALQMDKVGSNLGAVQKSLSGFSVSNVVSEILGIESAFGNLGAVADNVLSSISSGVQVLSTSLSSLAGDLASKAVGQIITGGMKRAQNIANAKFMIEGLEKDWNQLSDDINYAVSETAFGFDEAAMAAAQFSASGIEAGDNMKQALRAISGAAAMTNSSYSDMANIFTTVAGNGRLMGMQLTQLGMRGMNAAATLKNYFNSIISGEREVSESISGSIESLAAVAETSWFSEEAIRELTSKGLINFELFAAAMDDTFGEHAKKANETFNGAFANMKAALSRIGADFAAPIYEGARHVFLGLKGLFNNIRSGLNKTGFMVKQNENTFRYYTSVVNSFKLAVESAGVSIEKAFDSIASSNVIQDFIFTIGPILSATFIALSSVVKTFFDNIHLLFPYGEANFEWLAYITGDLTRHIENLGRALSTGLVPVMKIAGSVLGTFINLIKSTVSGVWPQISGFFSALAFDDLYGITSSLAAAAESIRHFTEVLIFGPEHMGNIHDFYNGLFRILGQLAGIPLKIISGGIWAISQAIDFMTNLLYPLYDFYYNLVYGGIMPKISDGLDVIATAMESVSGTISKLVQANLPIVLEYIGSAIEFVSGVAKEACDTVYDFVVTNIDFAGIWEAIASVFRDMASYISNLDFSGIKDFFDSFRSNFENFPSVGEALATILPMISDAFANFGENAKMAGMYLLGFIDQALGFLGISSGDIVKAAEDMGNALMSIKDGTFDFINSDPLGRIKEKFESFFNTLKELFLSIDINRIWNDVILGVFTGAGLKIVLFVTELINKLLTKKATLTGAFTDLLGSIKTFFAGLSGLTKNAKYYIIAAAIKEIAIAIGILAASLFIISLIDSAKLEDAKNTILSIGLMVTMLMLAMEKLAGSVKDSQAFIAMAIAFAGLGVALIGLSVAFLAFAGAVKILSTVGDALPLIAGGLMLVFAVLIGIMGVASYFAGTQMLKAGAGMVLCAVGIGLLVAALAGLALVAVGISLLPIEKLVDGMSRILTMMILLSGVVWLLNKAGVEKVSVGLTLFSLSIKLLSSAMITLAEAGPDIWNGILAFAAMSVILTMLMVAMKTLSKDTKGLGLAALSLVAVSAAIGLFSLSIVALSALDLGKTVKLIAALSLAMIAFGAALKLTQGSFMGGVGILAVAASMLILVGVVTALGTLPYGIVTQGILMLALAFTPLAIAVGIVQKFSTGALMLSILILSLSSAFLIGAVGIGILAYNLAMLATVLPGVKQNFSEVFGDDMGAALTNVLGLAAAALLLAVGVAALGVAALLLLPTLIALSLLVPALSLLFGGEFQDAVKDAASGLMVFVDAMADVANKIAERAPDFVHSGVAIFEAILEGLLSVAPAVFDAFLGSIEYLLTAIDTHLPVIMNRGLSIMLSIMNGIEQGIPMLTIAAGNMMYSFITSLAISIGDNRERLVAAMAMLGAALVSALANTLADGIASIFGEDNPVVQGLRGAASDVENAAADMASKANAAYESRMMDRGMPATTEECINQVKQSMLGSIPELGDIGEELSDVLSENFGIGLGDLPNLTDDQLDAVQSVINSSGIEVDIRAVASAIPEEFANGIDGTSEKVAAEMREVDAAVGSAGGNAWGSGYSTGSNYAYGVANGIGDHILLVANSAIDMALSAVESANYTFRESSPSKVGYQQGAYYSIGIANGIRDLGAEAVSSAEDTALGVIGATAGLASQIAEELDELNAAPTITPVFDTTGVVDGMAVLDAMMMQKQMMLAGWANAENRYDPVTQSRADNQAQTIYNTYLDYTADSSATDMVRDMTRKFKMANLLGG